MKHYLLIFNEDYADEHNVPALACMNQEEFDFWKEKPSGEINRNYEEEVKRKKKANNITAEYHKNQYANVTKEEVNEAYQYAWTTPVKAYSKLYARLGNSGEGFGESFSSFLLMKEFVEAGIVKVQEVDENFYKTFKQVRLDSLSLCNIFDLEDYE